jgi:hypothetical protein
VSLATWRAKSGQPGSIRTPSPLIGSANYYALGDLLGYRPAERAALVEEQAIWA